MPEQRLIQANKANTILGTDELQRAAHPGGESQLPGLEPLRQPEVNDAEIVVVPRPGEHDVEWLEVEVDHALAVNEGQAAQDLPHEDLPKAL